MTTAAKNMDALKKEIFSLEGFKPHGGSGIKIGFEPIEKAFPTGNLPTGVIHEFVSLQEDIAATFGFISALLSRFQQNGTCMWIGSSITVFPPALAFYNLLPHQMIFIEVKKDKDLLFTIEEALKCEKLAAVVAEADRISLNESRRLQLVTEKSGVTCFLSRSLSKSINPIASCSRWQISSLPSVNEEGLPGLTFPQWQVDLLKVRNGKPDSWQLTWLDGNFSSADEKKIYALPELNKWRKTG